MTIPYNGWAVKNGKTIWEKYNWEIKNLETKNPEIKNKKINVKVLKKTRFANKGYHINFKGIWSIGAKQQPRQDFPITVTGWPLKGLRGKIPSCCTLHHITLSPYKFQRTVINRSWATAPGKHFLIKVTGQPLKNVRENLLHPAYLHHITLSPYKFQRTVINRSWAAARTRFPNKGHWVTFKGHEGTNSFMLHIYTI